MQLITPQHCVMRWPYYNVYCIIVIVYYSFSIAFVLIHIVTRQLCCHIDRSIVLPVFVTPVIFVRLLLPLCVCCSCSRFSPPQGLNCGYI